MTSDEPFPSKLLSSLALVTMLGGCDDVPTHRLHKRVQAQA
jgi:hypothetical protein